jgi:protein TonB
MANAPDLSCGSMSFLPYSQEDCAMDTHNPMRHAHIAPEPDIPPPEPQKDPPPDNTPLPEQPPVEEPTPPKIPVKT